MTDLSRRSALSLALAATAAAAGKPATAQAPTPPDAAGQGQREPDATVAQGNSAAIDPASIAALRIYPPLANNESILMRYPLSRSRRPV